MTATPSGTLDREGDERRRLESKHGVQGEGEAGPAAGRHARTPGARWARPGFSNWIRAC